MEKSQLIFTILFGTGALVLLAFFLLFFLIRYRSRSNQYIHERENLKKEFEQTLLQSQIEVQENTFGELSGELHDNIGQLLVSAKTLIGVTQQNLANIPESLNVAEETIAKAIIELRTISKSLDKEWLQQFDLISNLQTEVKRFNSAKNILVNFSHPDKLLLPPQEQIILFRIVQEAIQNSIKHSQAEKINIIISNSVSALIINITDDGKGFKENMISPGLGLKNMMHRTKLLGGAIEWESLPGNGSTVTLKLPLKKIEQ